MLYHNIINTITKILSKDIIEQHMSYQIKGGFYKEIQKNNGFFINRNRQQNSRKKMNKSTCKAIIKERKEERMNSEIKQTKYNHEEIEIPEGAHANESQYVKYCGMEEKTILQKLRLNMIKFESNYGKREHVKYIKK